MTGNLDVPTNIEKALEERGFHVRNNKLGKGAYGEVLKAKCRDDGKLYAIKIILLSNGESTKYHKRELELLTKLELSERNVIKYFKSWIMQDGDVQRLCIQMELCWVNLGIFIYENDMGGAEIIKSEGSPRFYQQVFPQILNGLSVIHSMYWVHRDIHLGNILIVNPNPQRIDDIRVKIADFGLARYIGMEFEKSARLTVVPTLEKLSPGVGNELFRAPELSTEKYDFKVDVYSSGIVLYLLDCYLPNKDQLRDEILALREGKRNAVHLYHKDDQRLVKLIDELLEKESTRRPTAAEALQHMQRETDHGSEIPSEPTTKKFFVKKRDDVTLYRCSSSDTLSSMQDAIRGHRCVGIEKDAQILEQEKTIENEKRLVGITSDQDVREMFQSAEEQGKKVIVVVSEESNDNVAL
jgi:serine/threonine protein kinase